MKKEEVIAFFDSHAKCWDDNMICDDKKMNTILDTARVESGKDVLDIACGTGIMFDFYLNRGVKSVSGVDISSQMIDIASKKHSNDERVKTLCADAETYCFNNKYDCCIVFNAFPHFPNPDKLLENLSKAVKEGGTLTVAHDRGRKALDLHHCGEASKISCGLISETELANKFKANGYTDIKTVANDNIYIVSGTKQ